MGKLIAPLGIVLGAAVWFLLFVIIGIGLGTSFIAFGCVVAATFVAAAMLAARPILDAPITATGVLLGTATFVIMAVVLSIPLWVDVVSGLGVMGLYDIANAAIRPRRVTDAGEPGRGFAPAAGTGASNGHDSARREPVGAR